MLTNGQDTWEEVDPDELSYEVNLDKHPFVLIGFVFTLI